MKKFLMICVFLACGASNADVVYLWETVDAKGSNIPIFGRLVLTDDAWRSQRIDYTYNPTCPVSVCSEVRGDPARAC
jgi:hypothetical protein